MIFGSVGRVYCKKNRVLEFLVKSLVRLPPVILQTMSWRREHTAN